MSRESLNAVEDRTALAGWPGKLHHGGERKGTESETSGVGTKRSHELCQGLTFKRFEVLGRGLGRMFKPRPMRSGSGTDEARCQIEEVQQKLIGVLGRDAVFLECLVGKVRKIVGDNHVSSPANGSRQDMPIIWVWQGEGGNQLLKILNEAVANMHIHEVSRAPELRNGEIRSMVKHRPYPLVMNLCGPFGAKQIRQRQFEE
jgi:hypothetical protein